MKPLIIKQIAIITKIVKLCLRRTSFMCESDWGATLGLQFS